MKNVYKVKYSYYFNSKPEKVFRNEILFIDKTIPEVIQKFYAFLSSELPNEPVTLLTLNISYYKRSTEKFVFEC